MFPVLCFFFLMFLLGSCSPYQYVSPLPSAPQFTESGEVQAQIAIGRNHYEVQGSASFLKNFGASFNAFNAPHSAIRSYTVHYFRQSKRWPDLFVTGFAGYDKGNLHNDDHYTFFGGLSHRVVIHSSYETFRAGGGFYVSPRDKRIQYGYSLNFQQIQFYRLDAKHIPLIWAPYFTYTLKETQRYYLASPNFSITVFSKNRNFFLRHHVLLEIPISDPLTSEFHNSRDRYPETATIRPMMSPFCISIALGMRLVPMNLFRN